MSISSLNKLKQLYALCALIINVTPTFNPVLYDFIVAIHYTNHGELY